MLLLASSKIAFSLISASLHNNIRHPNKLAVGADFHCFNNKIEPKWEDPICPNGGKWTVTFQKGKSGTSWFYTLLAMIGEQFDHGDEMCGAVVDVRARQEKISIRTKNAANEFAQITLCKNWWPCAVHITSIGAASAEHPTADVFIQFVSYRRAAALRHFSKESVQRKLLGCWRNFTTCSSNGIFDVYANEIPDDNVTSALTPKDRGLITYVRRRRGQPSNEEPMRGGLSRNVTAGQSPPNQ
uniref:eIF-4F 25 kDa subunit n=1 Tax=Chenopodium quinoa TaxID=63459 RepID=A0A803MMP2_CHEQI